MASIEVSVSSGKPVRFRSSDEGPAWSKVVTRLKESHGPGVLVDAEGMQVLVNVDTDDLAPAGSYEWVTPGGARFDKIYIAEPPTEEGVLDFKLWRFWSVRDLQQLYATSAGLRPYSTETESLLDPRPINESTLQEGGYYVLEYAGRGMHSREPCTRGRMLGSSSDRMRTMQGFSRTLTVSHEDAAAEKAVAHLQELGDSNVRRICQKRFQSGKLAIEVDGMAAGDAAIALVEVKSKAQLASVEGLLRRSEKFQQLREVKAPGTKQLAGKKVLLFLSAASITTNADNASSMIRLAKEHQVELWLPNGQATSTGNGCFKSPHVHRAPFAPAVQPAAASPALLSPAQPSKANMLSQAAGKLASTMWLRRGARLLLRLKP